MLVMSVDAMSRKKKKIEIYPAVGDLILFREQPYEFNFYPYTISWPDTESCYGMCIAIEEEDDETWLGEKYSYLFLIQGGSTFWLFDHEYQKTRPAIMQVL